MTEPRKRIRKRVYIHTDKKSVRAPGETRGRQPLRTVLLTTQHCINGIKYGPGTVVVKANLAEVFREQERNFHDVETYLHQQGSAIIGAGSRLIKMPSEYFNDALNSVLVGGNPAGLVTRT